MSIVIKIQEAYIQAMKDKNEFRRDTLKLVKSAFGVLDTAGGSKPTEADYMNALTKMAKKLREDADQFPSLAQQNLAEAAELDEFIPKALSEYEVQAMLDQLLREGTIERTKKNMGLIVRTIVERSKGATDGKTVSTLYGKML